ncbi:VWA domain-containing protein [Chthoniobacter flavus]|uniref:VWA domain-containing protein n=1 Tax=Chthoniobacter flavus TaxID=191863 RepID=UPI0005B27EEB|nr:VWA domain-containing protein [Chthoniobacter flavus]
MSSFVDLAHPWALAFALVVVFLVWAQHRSLADMTPLQRKVCFALRVFIMLLLVLALAGIRWLLPSQELSVLFVVDHSASISAPAQKEARNFVSTSLAAQHTSDTAGVIGFAAKPELWQAPAVHLQPAAQWPEPTDRKATDIGGALDFASAIFPAGKARRVVLLTDGNDTGGQAAAGATRLAAQGVELMTVPLHNESAPEVLVEKVEVPRRLKAGEPFDLTAHIRSNVVTTAKVKLYQNQFLIEQRDMEIKVGDNAFRAPNLKADGNFITYEVEILPAQDTVAENNRASATASLRGEPKVLLVDSDENNGRALAGVLQKEKISVETRGLSALPKTLEDLQQFDLFLLSDVSALNLGRQQMDLYRRWVQDFGGGFVMIGGENSFGVGGYYRTPIEQMLPVRMEHDDRLDTPTVAMLVVLDRSGSMTAAVAGQTKISLADQGAVFAMNALQPKDYFGVVAVDTKPHTVVPLAPISAKGAAEQKILSITAGGGGIYIYTSMVEAFQQLRDIPARVKHLLLFSDAADAEEKAAGEMSDGIRTGGNSLDLASAMLAAKITTSVVGLGTEQDKDTPFLRQLAERGSGRFYLTDDATTLPQIFSTETMKVAQSSLIEEPFLAVAMNKSPITTGIDWPQSPLLLGYNATKPKPTADILLATEHGEPLLATWRYGLGQAAAFTSDAKSRWAAEWLTWPGYGKFWSQLVRSLMRKSDQSSFQVNTSETGHQLELTIDAIKPDGSFRNQMPVSVNMLRADGSTETHAAEQEGPGQYRALFDLPEEGTSIFSVSSPDLPDGGYVFGHTRSYPEEFLRTEVNESLLHTLTSLGRGKFAPSPAEVFARPTVAARTHRELTNYFLELALLLLPLDIWLRRRTWRA